jgi:predicted RNase H-like HicB family nuclease
MESQPEGGFTVTFPDVPEVMTEGDTAADAEERAEAALRQLGKRLDVRVVEAA